MLWVRKMQGTAATESALINLGNVGISDAIVCLIDGTGIQGCHAVLLRNLFGQVCLSQLDGAPTDDAHVQLGQKYNLGRDLLSQKNGQRPRKPQSQNLRYKMTPAYLQRLADVAAQ